MKNKKLMLTVVGLVMSAVSAFSFAACDSNGGGKDDGKDDGGNKHVHQYVWGDIITPPTCTEPGTQKGICPDDNDTTTRSVDPTGHDWGEWQVTPPTAADDGVAVKHCQNDAEDEHPTRVDLPAYGNSSAYTVSEPNENGEVTYTYPHSLGNITFVVAPKTQKDYTIEEAVTFSTTDAKHALVRSGTGYYGGGRVKDNYPTSAVSYTYGDEYVYVDDGSMFEKRYYESDELGDTGVFAVTEKEDDNKEKKVTINKNATVENLIGPEFSLTYVTRSERYYGVEDIVKGFYDWGNTDGVRGYTEYKVGKNDEKFGKTNVFSFSFNFFNANYGQYYTEIYVDFTLNASNVIDWVSVQAFSYIPAEYTGDETNGYTPNADANPYWDRIVMSQTMKTPEDEEPVNPYTKKVDYDITYSFKGTELKDGDIITDLTPGNSGDANNFTINMSFGEDAAMVGLLGVSVFYVDEEGGETEIDDWGTVYGGSLTYFRRTGGDGAASGSIQMRMMYAGNYTLKFVCGNSAFTVHLNAPKKAPATLKPYIYEYAETTNSFSEANKTTAEVYKGKTLMFTTKSDNPMNEDASYTAAVTSAPDGANYALTDGVYNETDVTCFTAEAAGTYKVKLTSTIDSNKTSTITVTVKDFPDMTDTFKGLYENSKNGLSVEFAEEGNTVTVKSAEGEEVLSYAYADGVVTCNHVSGATLGYELGFNYLYSLVLVKDDGFESQTFALKAVEVVGELSLDGTRWENGNRYAEFYANGKFKIGMGSGDWYVTGDYVLSAEANGKQVFTFSNGVDGDSTMSPNLFTISGANGGKSFVTIENGVYTKVTIQFKGILVELTLV